MTLRFARASTTGVTPRYVWLLMAAMALLLGTSARAQEPGGARPPAAALPDTAGGPRAAPPPGAPATVVGDTVAADERLPGDSLEQVQREAAAARERIEEARQALESFPAEDRPRRSPTGAVLRAFALPGWGQLYTGHKFRALMYGSAEVGFAALGFLEQGKVNELKDDISRARLDFIAEEQAAHPDSVFSRADTLALFTRFESTPEGLTLDAQLESKQKQREDFFTYALFSAIFAAIDAFVSAHLEAYREPGAEILLDVTPGEKRVGLRLPVGADPGAPRP